MVEEEGVVSTSTPHQEVEINRVLKKLFIGTVKAAQDDNVLKAFGIKSIINLGTEPFFPGVNFVSNCPLRVVTSVYSHTNI